MMKRHISNLLIATALLLSISGTASADVTFRFSANSTGGISASVKSGIERDISSLLTEINDAAVETRSLNLSPMNTENGAKQRLTMLWRHVHFSCVDQLNVSNCLNDMQGYQVRGIAITVRSIDGTYKGSPDRELTISINRKGVITGVRFSSENHEEVSKILREGNVVTDQAERREILKWVEDFRCYYNEKNIDAIEQIFSEDALIITGSVVKAKRHIGDERVRLKDPDDVRYKKMEKAEYIRNLKGVFSRNEWIDVQFDNISVAVDGSRKNIYGVKLKQKWSSPGYSDEGWLFLMWDFGDKDHPQIHVRTWQPGNVEDDDIFELADFFIK